jgi:hypothetical protein
MNFAEGGSAVNAGPLWQKNIFDSRGMRLLWRRRTWDLADPNRRIRNPQTAFASIAFDLSTPFSLEI